MVINTDCGEKFLIVLTLAEHDKRKVMTESRTAMGSVLLDDF